MNRYGPRPPVVVAIPHALVAAVDASGLSTRDITRITEIPVSTVGLVMGDARKAIRYGWPPERFPHTNVVNARALARALNRPVGDLFAQPVDLAGGLG